jgi:hypothetical protein
MQPAGEQPQSFRAPLVRGTTIDVDAIQITN